MFLGRSLPNSCRLSNADGRGSTPSPPPPLPAFAAPIVHPSAEIWSLQVSRILAFSEIDERYLDSPYYLTPEDKVGQDAFAVIR
jgi:hypothetical protein